jgi:hypothetical protein
MAIVSKKSPCHVTSTRDQHPTLGHRSDPLGSGTWPGVEGRVSTVLALQLLQKLNDCRLVFSRHRSKPSDYRARITAVAVRDGGSVGRADIAGAVRVADLTNTAGFWHRAAAATGRRAVIRRRHRGHRISGNRVPARAPSSPVRIRRLNDRLRHQCRINLDMHLGFRHDPACRRF